MERLLNIKEAAEILNVSEMTMRRWTNAGLLHCYRVGGKRERRFRIQDLHAFLERDTGPADRSEESLGFGGYTVPDGSHLTHLSLDTGEALDVGASYLREGLNNGETVLLVAHAARAELILRNLQERGVDVKNFRKKGKLHLNGGTENPPSQVRAIGRVAAESGGRFRLFGDMSWATKKGWSLEALRELEETTNALPTFAGKLFLCQYPLESFSGLAAMMAVETHGYTLYRGELRESPYFKRKMIAKDI